jgi:uncharacterized protein YeeX (DUF496 family)
MKELILELLKVGVEIAVLFLTPYVIKALASIEKKAVATMGATNFDLAKTFTNTIVKSVEQMNPNLIGEQKFILVFDAIDNKFGDNLTKEEIEHLIECAVKEYNVSIGKEVINTTQTESIEQ